MSPQEFSDALAKLKTTKAEFARHAGYHANTVSAWATGKTLVPAIVERYLKLRLMNLEISETLRNG